MNFAHAYRKFSNVLLALLLSVISVSTSILLDRRT